MNRIQAILTVTLILAGPAWTGLASNESNRQITKVYDVKWRKAGDLASLLRGFPHTRVNPNNRPFNTITVLAPPDQHLIFQELIRKYDTPPKQVLFEFYILGAKRDGEGTKNGLPANIRDVVEDLSALTKYQKFEVFGHPMITVGEGGGNSLSLKTKAHFVLEIGGVRVVPGPDRTSIVVDRFQFGAEGAEITASIATPFVAASGETLVIGTSHVSNSSDLSDAVIVVVTPTVLESPSP